MTPVCPPSGPAVEYPSPVSRRPSECFSDMSGSRRGSSAGFVSDVEGKGHWPVLGSESASAKSPLANFGFFKNLTGEKKTTRDGQPPKRRGPKPDSKPALTRRQELNRQAQRTHRERKEMYIKALEQEVLRLKEAFTTTVRERDAMAEENRRLKELLLAHGITFDLSSPSGSGMGGISSSGYGRSSSGSVSGGYGPGTNSTGYTSPPNIPGQPLSTDTAGGQMVQTPPTPQQQQQNGGAPVDYDQVGIDFVLTLERPCMDHIQFLLLRAHESDEGISGHALMASCPPQSQVLAHPEETHPLQMPDLQTPDLLKLLDLSARLPLEGEITPVMAWAMILQDPRVTELNKDDIESVKGDLLAKIRCYGFGAVLEEFEVRDALMTVLAGKTYHGGNHLS